MTKKMTPKFKKILLAGATLLLTVGVGYGAAKHIANKKQDKAKQAEQAQIDNYVSEKKQQIKYEADSLHTQARHLFHDMIREYNDSINQADLGNYYTYGAIPIFPYGSYSSVAEEKDDKFDFLSSVLTCGTKEQSDFYRIVLQDLVEAGYNGQNLRVQKWVDVWSEGYTYDIESVELESKISDEDLNDFEARNCYDENAQHIIPDFTKNTFKKHKPELDKICARLNSLKETEKSLKQISKIQDTVLIDFSKQR